MGKKKVSTQSNEEALKEGAAIDAAVAKSGGKKSKRVEKGIPAFMRPAMLAAIRRMLHRLRKEEPSAIRATA